LVQKFGGDRHKAKTRKPDACASQEKPSIHNNYLEDLMVGPTSTEMLDAT